MTATSATIALAGLALCFAMPYIVYPVLIRLVPRRRVTEPPSGEVPLRRVSVLIPAHNEGLHLERKLCNTLTLDYTSGLLEVIVCSDGSTDETDRVALGFAEAGVRLVRNEERSGKAVTLNRLVSEATSDLLLLTDASAMLTPNTLQALCRALEDERVAVACARYVVQPSHGGEGDTEAGYWSFESRMREAEAERDLLLGASGAAYLIRRQEMPELPADTVNDDFVVPLEARVRGRRIAYVPEAVATDAPTDSLSTLYHRWVRIAYGNYQMLWRFRGSLLFGGRLMLPLWRKLLRTLGPVFLVAMMAVLFVARERHVVFEQLCIIGCALLGAGLLCVAIPNRGLGRARPFRVGRFLLLAQLAYLNGLLRALVGSREGLWKRGSANEAIDLTRPAPIPLRVRALKRLVDLAASSLALLLLWPLLLYIAIRIKLDSPGPVLYRQTRLRPGPRGRPVEFAMLKFRSMVIDAEAECGPVWARKQDERVTRVGEFLRKHRLDELPQFVNILRGDMSLVGPRPEREFFAGPLEEKIPGYGDRHMLLRPGLTGWAQVMGDYDTTVESVKAKVVYDLAYLAHLYHLHTYLKMEAKVIYKTVWVVLSGKGAR